MNWGLLKYDVIIIDECGMVRDIHMEHVMKCIDSLPVPTPLLLVGDPLQQLPLQSTDTGTGLSKNIFQQTNLLKRCDRFTLKTTQI